MKNKKTRISTSIPAFIDSVVSETSSSKHTTMAKLRVFHKGITGDGRRFSEEFSHKLLRTLPETPVVALYNVQEDDFIGHAERQGVFGYVPENANVYFEEVDGREWAVTDVKLFTEREDVGSIAKKIIGKEHSLELDPYTVDFEFADDEEDDYWITYTDGNLIGLSVLGEWDTPAFGGSGFFNEQQFTLDLELNLDAVIAKYIALPKEVEINQNGGETMFLKFAQGLFEAIQIESVLENDHFLIYKVGNKTYIAFPDGEEMTNVDITEAFDPAVQGDPAEEPEVEENLEEGDEPEAHDEVVEEVVEEAINEDSLEPEVVEEEAQEINEETEQEQNGVESQAPENPADATALSNAEREELENYRRTNKKGLIAEYSEYLPEETLNNFNNSIDSYTVEELEKQLSFEAMKKIKADKESTVTDTFTRSFVTQSEVTSVDEMDMTVSKYLRKDTRGEN